MRRLGPAFLNHPLRDQRAHPVNEPERAVATDTTAGRPGDLCRRLAAAVLVGAVSVVLAACGNSGSAQTLDGAPSNPVSAPPPSLRPAQGLSGPSAEVVLRAYRGYWSAQVRAMSTGHADGSDLSTYATGEALSDSYANVVRLVSAGLLMSGAPQIHPVVTSVGPLRGDPAEQQATLQDCLDVSGWHQVTAQGGRTSEPGDRLLRYPLEVTARTVGGAWMISQVTRETGRTC
ncbi:hypothetical protein [Streptacidiphilus neutrinimicus]|uniref:hypothetical protein n=1 Tax=Streptacidiphilus neutrinimicus TaxID=105420 RepID=UPI001269C7B1|nr:hypothetical protein [Streptacidiphilus neutrinimicus]